MTQFSFGWILSLNWLCQKWGQVQNAAGAMVSYGNLIAAYSSGAKWRDTLPEPILLNGTMVQTANAS
jgi:hypothetical protein